MRVENWRRLACWLLLGLGLAAMGAGDGGKPFLHPLFTDHLILQRDIAAPVWGWTTPGATVTVEVAGKKAEATADAGGKWLAKLGPLPAGGPYTLTVTGPQTVTLQDVLVGDVWICSGQSNMQMSVGGVNNAKDEIAQADFPQIRLYTVPDRPAETPQELISGAWSVCTPQTIPGFSAVGYFFGREIHRAEKVPIGLINSSWGGTICEAWASAAALKTMPDFAPEVEKMAGAVNRQVVSPEEYPAALSAWMAKNDPEPAGVKRIDPAFDDVEWKSIELPGAWSKVGPTDFRGVMWLRKAFLVPEEGEGMDVNLHLGIINDSVTVWCNGVKVGEGDDRKKALSCAVPGKLVKAGTNVVVLRVLSMGTDGGVYGKARELSVEFNAPDLEPIMLGGAWRYRVGVALNAEHVLPQRADYNPNRVTVLYNGMIAPLLPFAIKGAIWYQGESNAGRPFQYRTLMPTMITDWRNRFGVGDFPFFIVSLANFMAVQTQPSEGGWAELREAQWLTTKRIPNVGIGMVIDIGDAGNIHPRNKQEVGRRLALSAEAIAYGKTLVYSGPMYRAMQVEGNKIRLTFDHIGGGLVAKDGPLKGFAIAGADKQFVWADAVIDGDTLLVSSPAVPAPTVVRYDWANNPEGNFYNKAGLPAVPFRTDP